MTDAAQLLLDDELVNAVLALNTGWNAKEPEHLIAERIDLCRRLAVCHLSINAGAAVSTAHEIAGEPSQEDLRQGELTVPAPNAAPQDEATKSLMGGKSSPVDAAPIAPADAPTVECPWLIDEVNPHDYSTALKFLSEAKRQRDHWKSLIDGASGELPPRVAPFAAFCGRTRIVIDEADYLRYRESATLSLAKERALREEAHGWESDCTHVALLLQFAEAKLSAASAELPAEPEFYPPSHSTQELLNQYIAWGRSVYAHATSQAVRLEAMGEDAERLDWVGKSFFEHRWNGVIGEGSYCNWTMRGDWRHTAQKLRSNNASFRDAIDAARKEKPHE